MSKKSRGYSIKIFVPEGDPGGLRIVEKANWTGCGVICPRPVFKSSKGRSEFARPGVYILWAEGEGSGLPRVYIGGAESIRKRLLQHDAKKDFWTRSAFFTSKDETLNRAHVQYLESSLYDRAKAAGACELDNANRPDLPQLSESETADVANFLEELLQILPLIGLGLFEKPAAKLRKRPLLHLNAKGIEARGYESTDGFVVVANSTAVLETVPSAQAGIRVLRKALAKNGILQTTSGDCLRLTQDYEFGSPSYAAGVILGRNENGRLSWRDDAGRTLKELQGGGANKGNGDEEA